MPSKLFKYRRGFKTECEKYSNLYRKRLGLKSFNPLPAADLATYLEIKIICPSNIPGMNGSLLKKIQVKDDWSAITIQTETGIVIIHNDCHSKARQESDIMHELAHVICQHPFDGIKINHAGNINLRSYVEEYEKEAEWLGATLQLSREALIWALKRKMDYQKIMEHFSASEQMIRFRLNTSGVLYQYRYFDPFN